MAFNFAFGGGDDDDFNSYFRRGGGGGGGRGGGVGVGVSSSKFYESLGVDKGASESDIKKAYRKAAMQHHPDKGGDAEKFKEISKAYEILSDPEKKKIYDQYGEEGLENGGMGGGGGASPMDIFDLFMGGGGMRGGDRGGRGRRKGEDVVFPLKVGLDELYSGTTKKLRLTKSILCNGCAGRGGKGESTCKDCHGQGARVVIRQIGPGMIQQMQMQCSTCAGEGSVIAEKDKCKKCAGQKVVKDKKTLEVFVKKGVNNGQRIVFNGEGDEMPDVIPGDVIVVIQQIDHPLFKREGSNLLIKKTLHLVEALTGFSFTIPHLDGRLLLVKSDGIVKPGDWKAIRNEGMPDQKNPFIKGNLYIEFDILFPVPGSINNKQKELLLNILGTPTSIPLAGASSSNHHHNNNNNNGGAMNVDKTSSMNNNASEPPEEVTLVSVDINAERARYEGSNRESYEEDDERRHAHGQHAPGCRSQ